jgi:hypothetical protein
MGKTLDDLLTRGRERRREVDTLERMRALEQGSGGELFRILCERFGGPETDLELLQVAALEIMDLMETRRQDEKLEQAMNHLQSSQKIIRDLDLPRSGHHEKLLELSRAWLEEQFSHLDED